jgi:hypothetical protein
MVRWRDDARSPQSRKHGQWARRTLIVVYDIAQVMPSAVMRPAHAHGVVRQVDVAVVACGFVAEFEVSLQLRRMRQRAGKGRRRFVYVQKTATHLG